MVNGNLFLPLWLVCNCILFKHSRANDVAVPEWLHTFTSCPSPWPTFQIVHDPKSDPKSCHQQCQGKCEGGALFLDNDVNQLRCYHHKTTSHMKFDVVDNVSTCSCGGRYERYETFLELRKKITGEFEKCVPETKVTLDHIYEKSRVPTCKNICDATNVYWQNGPPGAAPRMVICQIGKVQTAPLKGKCDLNNMISDGLFSCHCGVKPKNLIPNSNPEIAKRIATKNNPIDGFKVCRYPFEVEVMFAFTEVSKCDESCSRSYCKGSAFYDNNNELLCYSEKIKPFARIKEDRKQFICECGVYIKYVKISDVPEFKRCEEPSFSWTMDVPNEEVCNTNCEPVRALVYEHMGKVSLLGCVHHSKTTDEVSIRGRCKNKIYNDEAIKVRYRECYCGIPLPNIEQILDDEVKLAASLLINIKWDPQRLPITANLTHRATNTISPKSKTILNKRQLRKLRSIAEVMESTSQTSAPEVNLHPSHPSARVRANQKSRFHLGESSSRNNPAPSVTHENSRGKRIAEPCSDSERTESEHAISTSISGAESSTDSSHKSPKDSDGTADSVEKHESNKKRRNKENLKNFLLSNSSYLDGAGTSKRQTDNLNPRLVLPTSRHSHSHRRARSEAPTNRGSSKWASFQVPSECPTKSSTSKQPVAEIPSASNQLATDISPAINRKQKKAGKKTLTSENLRPLNPSTSENATSKTPVTYLFFPQILTSPKHKRTPRKSESPSKPPTSKISTTSEPHAQGVSTTSEPPTSEIPTGFKLFASEIRPALNLPTLGEPSATNPPVSETSSPKLPTSQIPSPSKQKSRTPSPDIPTTSEPPTSEIPTGFKLFASEIRPASTPLTLGEPSATKPPISEISSPKPPRFGIPSTPKHKSRTRSLEVPTTSDRSQKSATPGNTSTSRSLPEGSTPKTSSSETQKRICAISPASNEPPVLEKPSSHRKSKNYVREGIEIEPMGAQHRTSLQHSSSSCANNPKSFLDTPTAGMKSGMPGSAQVDDVENPQPKRNKRLHDSQSSNPARIEHLPTDGEPQSSSRGKQTSDAHVSAENVQEASKPSSSSDNSSSKSGTQHSSRSARKGKKLKSAASPSKQESSSSYDSDNWLKL